MSVRVLHFFGRMERGGAELRTLDVMRTLRRDVVFEFCALSGQPGVLDAEIRRLGGEVHLLKLDWAFPMRLRELLRERRFDVVHSHVHDFSGAIVRLASLSGTPRRIAHYRSTSDGKRRSLRRVLQRALMHQWIDAHATHILAVSRSAMTRGWGERWRSDPRCRVVYNGIDLTAFDDDARRSVRQEIGVPADAPLVLHVGRWDAAKNHARLLSIHRALRSRVPDARLVLVGKGGNELEASARREASLLGNDAVRFLGERADVARLLASADAFVFPSLWEGLPGALLEACAAGLPVVASAIEPHCEIAETVDDVQCVPLAADDHVWASALMEALSKSDAARAEERRLRFTQSPFSLPRVAAELRAIYEGAR